MDHRNVGKNFSPSADFARPKKSIFSLIFLFAALILMALPVVVTVNEALTKVVERTGWYRWIESTIVPVEVRMVSVTLKGLGLEVVSSPTTISIRDGDSWQRAYISWNCIGWQSFILVLVTLGAGLQGGYRFRSVLQVILIALFGTFLMNIARISIVYLFLYVFGYFAAIIFHDYFSTVFTIVWLFFLWWLAYRFFLEPTPLAASSVRLSRS